MTFRCHRDLELRPARLGGSVALEVVEGAAVGRAGRVASGSLWSAPELEVIGSVLDGSMPSVVGLAGSGVTAVELRGPRASDLVGSERAVLEEMGAGLSVSVMAAPVRTAQLSVSGGAVLEVAGETCGFEVTGAALPGPDLEEVVVVAVPCAPVLAGLFELVGLAASSRRV